MGIKIRKSENYTGQVAKFTQKGGGAAAKARTLTKLRFSSNFTRGGIKVGKDGETWILDVYPVRRDSAGGANSLLPVALPAVWYVPSGSRPKAVSLADRVNTWLPRSSGASLKGFVDEKEGRYLTVGNFAKTVLTTGGNGGNELNGGGISLKGEDIGANAGSSVFDTEVTCSVVVVRSDMRVSSSILVTDDITVFGDSDFYNGSMVIGGTLQPRTLLPVTSSTYGAVWHWDASTGTFSGTLLRDPGLPEVIENTGFFVGSSVSPKKYQVGSVALDSSGDIWAASIDDTRVKASDGGAVIGGDPIGFPGQNNQTNTQLSGSLWKVSRSTGEVRHMFLTASSPGYIVGSFSSFGQVMMAGIPVDEGNNSKAGTSTIDSFLALGSDRNLPAWVVSYASVQSGLSWQGAASYQAAGFIVWKVSDIDSAVTETILDPGSGVATLLDAKVDSTGALWVLAGGTAAIGVNVMGEQQGDQPANPQRFSLWRLSGDPVAVKHCEVSLPSGICFARSLTIKEVPGEDPLPVVAGSVTVIPEFVPIFSTVTNKSTIPAIFVANTEQPEFIELQELLLGTASGLDFRHFDDLTAETQNEGTAQIAFGPATTGDDVVWDPASSTLRVAGTYIDGNTALFGPGGGRGSAGLQGLWTVDGVETSVVGRQVLQAVSGTLSGQFPSTESFTPEVPTQLGFSSLGRSSGLTDDGSGTTWLIDACYQVAPDVTSMVINNPKYLGEALNNSLTLAPSGSVVWSVSSGVSSSFSLVNSATFPPALDSSYTGLPYFTRGFWDGTHFRAAGFTSRIAGSQAPDTSSYYYTSVVKIPSDGSYLSATLLTQGDVTDGVCSDAWSGKMAVGGLASLGEDPNNFGSYVYSGSIWVVDLATDEVSGTVLLDPGIGNPSSPKQIVIDGTGSDVFAASIDSMPEGDYNTSLSGSLWHLNIGTGDIVHTFLTSSNPSYVLDVANGLKGLLESGLSVATSDVALALSPDRTPPVWLGSRVVSYDYLTCSSISECSYSSESPAGGIVVWKFDPATGETAETQLFSPEAGVSPDLNFMELVDMKIDSSGDAWVLSRPGSAPSYFVTKASQESKVLPTKSVLWRVSASTLETSGTLIPSVYGDYDVTVANSLAVYDGTTPVVAVTAVKKTSSSVMNDSPVATSSGGAGSLAKAMLAYILPGSDSVTTRQISPPTELPLIKGNYVNEGNITTTTSQPVYVVGSETADAVTVDSTGTVRVMGVSGYAPLFTAGRIVKTRDVGIWETRQTLWTGAFDEFGSITEIENLELRGEVGSVGRWVSDPSVPGAPKIVTATPGDGTVTLTWLPGYYAGSQVGAYSIYDASTDQAIASIVDMLGGTPEPTYTVTEISGSPLTNGVEYSFYVTAINATGESTRSNVAKATPASLVTDGLVFHLDAAKTASYSGTGSTWYDLTANGKDVTLYNSPAWDPSGWFTFNGADQYGDMSTSGLVYGLNPRTLSAWFYVDSESSPDYYQWAFSYGTASPGSSYFVGTGGSNELRGGGGFDWGQDIITNIDSVYDKWINLTVTYDGALANLYYNGSLVGTDVRSWDAVQNLAYVGKQTNDLQYLKGKVSQVVLYDKALSDAEVLQNFNALRLRFGV